MEQGRFKFEPIWISVLSAIPVFIFYQIYKMAVKPAPDLKEITVFAIPALLVSAMFLPMFFKMLSGIPAILLTEDQLVDNVVGVAIDWSNIKDIRITGVKKPFLSIILKDTDLFYSNIYNPIKRTLLKLLFSLSAGDVSVNLALVAGDNDAVAATAKVQWARYYGIDD
jgi:hypothetical protein